MRSSDYNTVGRVTTWNLRLTYAPTNDVRFRGAYSRATRAPNLSELYQGAAQNFPTGVNDAVGSIDIPTLLNQCLLTGSPTYCTSVFRDPNSGKLTRIDQVSINTATLLTAGVDIGATSTSGTPSSRAS